MKKWEHEKATVCENNMRMRNGIHKYRVETFHMLRKC